jgi:integral membrane protein
MSSTQLDAAGRTRAYRPRGRALLITYRVLAYVTAVLLLVLCFVAVPLQIWAHRPTMAMVVGQIHGFLYIVYVLVAFVITMRLRVRLVRTILILLAGTIPFGAFFAERYVTRVWNARTGQG